ncbi:hypothetical protein C0989_000270, partial [Termitomyces sp. Mn162]
IPIPAASSSEVMEVDDNGPELITALMQSLAHPQQLYLPLPTGMHPLDALLSLSSALRQPMVASTSKEKGKATAMAPPIPAQGSSTPLLTTWKMVKQHFFAKEKGKGKAKEPEPLTTTDEQLTQLLQWLHEARVPEISVLTSLTICSATSTSSSSE